MFNLFNERENRFLSSDTLRIIELSDRGDEEAKKELYKLFEKGMTDEELNKYRRMKYSQIANDGDPFGMYWMGFISSVIDRNKEKTLFWYTKAAEKGNVDAMKALAFAYCEYINENDLGYGPIGLGYDINKERYWLKKAIDNGDDKSLCDLGDSYYYESDKENAAIMYKRALLSKDFDVVMKAKEGLSRIDKTI